MRFLLIQAGLAALCLAVLAVAPGKAQDAEADDPPRLSREEWLATVEAARRRIDQMRREHRSFLPTAEDEAEEASRRAIEDESLQAGDIVSTSKGLFRFKGRPGSSPKPDDFVPLPKPRR
jgi:hypothetical protein